MAEFISNTKWPPPGLLAAARGMTAASKAMRVFVDELSQTTQKNFEQTTKILEELQNVREIGDLLALQTKFVQNTFENFNERLHRMSTLMAAMPAELARAAENALQQVYDTASVTGDKPPHQS